MLPKQVYPFERLTEASKSVLILAQEESEHMSLGYIGSELLLLALLRQRGSVAGETLARIGLAENEVRRRVEEVMSPNTVSGPIHPTPRTKKVIEMSFREARSAGSETVGTDHILLALIDEGEGIAAHLLRELGASAEVVRRTVDAVRVEGLDEAANASPPERILELRRALSLAIDEKRAAADRDDMPAAAAALLRERQLRGELSAAEVAWRKHLYAED